ANNKYITTYFRKSFNFNGQTDFNNLTLDILRDDGAVVYLNGAEVYRTNMPSGAIGYRTTATTAIGGTDETTFLQTTVSPSLLVAGNNVLAVEIHQANATSSDISFDFDLVGQTATPTASVTRGAYLQMGTPNAMTIRWRTNIATNSRVQFGTIQGSLLNTVDDANLTTEHEIRLTGLVANTKYFYSIGSTSVTLAGNDVNHFFFTSPNAGQANPYRVWVLGDSGTADANAQAVRNAYLTYNGSTYTNLLLMLGDNAYQNGTDAEYQTAVFDMYPTTLRQTPLWSTIGNHDTAQSTNPPSSLPYFQIFTLPTGTEGGGAASGTEKYYSFNYGNIHFICLDSMTTSRATGSAMLTWLESDLSQNIQPWVIAFWHHPPYSKGSHNSDTETQLIEMRTNILPILESWGVDLVLSGHSHSYERSFLIDGHYGTSGTFTESMKKNSGGGRENIDGAYTKSALSPNLPNQGAVYAVAGSSGQATGGLLNHPAMFISLNNLGSMVLDINNNRLDAKFLRENGTIADYFTIIKGGTPPTPPVSPSNLTTSGISSSAINLAWTDGSTNEDGFKIERSTDGTNFTEIATTAANVTTYSAGSLQAATQYYFRVRAYNTGGNSAYTNTANAMTLPAPPTVPNAPTGFSAATISASQINLSWTDNASNEDGFKIERCSGAACSNFAQVATVGANTTTFSSTGLAKNTTFCYRVRAYNTGGNSAYSNIASAKTLKR
ncbi:MAG: fibronectin type III domain-containing protein, partial [Acidobacteriota bacterium]|nr:fibronectin type III domain-containing protein [Acidobacteriota bacterium]